MSRVVTNLLADGTPSVELDAATVGSGITVAQPSAVPVWTTAVRFTCATSPDAFSARAMAALARMATQQPSLSSELISVLRTLLVSPTINVDAVKVWANWSPASSVANAWRLVGNASGPANLASINTATTADTLTSHLLLAALSAESLTQLKLNLPVGPALFGNGGNDGPTLPVQLYVRLNYNGGHQDVFFDFTVQFANR